MGRSIPTFTVPAATSGDGTIAYTASGLPGGLTMSAARIVSGTPTATGSGTARITATDADGDFASVTFDWTVYTSVPVLSANPNPSTTSDFTVSWNAFHTYDEEYYLVETAPDGTVTSYPVLAAREKKFIAKPDGTFNYRMKGCRTEFHSAEVERYTCSNLGNALNVQVDGPEADSVSKQLDYTYTAHVGHYDDNMLVDLLIKRTSPGTGAGIFQTVILSQESRGNVKLVVPSDTEIMTMSAYPVASTVELVLGDYNLDGFVDILLRGLGKAITGALDQIAYAPGGKVGGHSTVLNAVDDDFTSFVTQTSGWIRDIDYFEKNATRIPVGDYLDATRLRRCREGATTREYLSESICAAGDTFIRWEYAPFPNTMTILSYKKFNDDALEFARQFSLVDGRISPDVTLGSQSAKNLSRVFKDVLGVEFIEGKLEQACTGTLSYDADSSIPCDSPALIGRILLGFIDTLIPPAHAQNNSNVNTQLPKPTPGLVGYGRDFPATHGGGTYRRGQYGTARSLRDRTLAADPSGKFHP